MKTNSTFYAAVLCLTLFLSSTSATSQATFQYNFNGVPALISGTANQVNAQYRFSNVSAGVDALVKIVSATNGATVDIFDDNTITKPEGFSPKIKVPANKTGLVEFQICFVATGTANNLVQDSLFATAIDIDGNATVKEIDVIDLGGGLSTFQVGAPEISVTQNGSAFTGKNVAGNEYDGIDTSAKKVMFTVINNNVSCFTYKCGAANTGAVVSRQKSIYFKNFTYPVTGTLSVKYASFEAVALNKAVNLKWVTAFEQNHDHFEVERSFDNNNFKTIGVVLDGFTAEGTKKNYQFKDNSSELQGKSIVYYRLKQIDLDGKVSYSIVLAVRFEDKGGLVMQASPNPFMESLVVRFNASVNGKAEIRIISITGQTSFAKQSVVSKGYNNIQIDGLGKLCPGIYMAQLIINGVIIESQKVIKK